MAVLTKNPRKPPSMPKPPPGVAENPTIFLRPMMRQGTIRDLRVNMAGCQLKKDSWIHHPFSDYAIGFVVSGRGTYQVDDGPVQAMEPGCIFAVYPGPRFHYGPFEGTTWAEYHFALSGPALPRLLDFGWFPSDGIVRQLVNIPPLVEIMRELIRLVRRDGPGDADRCVVLAERLLVEMYHSQEKLQQSHLPSRSLASVLDYCREHFKEEVDFEALAKEHATSYSSLRQGMKKLTGMGPAHYLARLRCQTACELLSDTDLSVKEIGARVGIPDPYAFSRVFKRHIGQSPQHFRERTAPWAR